MIMKKKKTVLSKLMKVVKITGFSLGGIALVLYVSPYFFKDQINEGIKSVVENYVKTEIEFKNGKDKVGDKVCKSVDEIIKHLLRMLSTLK